MFKVSWGRRVGSMRLHKTDLRKPRSGCFFNKPGPIHGDPVRLRNFLLEKEARNNRVGGNTFLRFDSSFCDIRTSPTPLKSSDRSEAVFRSSTPSGLHFQAHKISNREYSEPKLY